MRTLRMASVALTTLALVIGSAIATGAQQTPPINAITGSIAVERPDGGTSDAIAELLQFRDFSVTGSATTDDVRLTGDVVMDLNWDKLADTTTPVPAWGTMQIDVEEKILRVPVPRGVTRYGTWSGTFTGLQLDDGSALQLRAFLIGERAYESLCATLDIDADGVLSGGAWNMDGIVHRMPELA